MLERGNGEGKRLSLCACAVQITLPTALAWSGRAASRRTQAGIKSERVNVSVGGWKRK